MLAHSLISEAARRALLGGFFGTALESFDFLLHGSAAGLVFNKLFFPRFLVKTARASELSYQLGNLTVPSIGGKKLLVRSGIDSCLGFFIDHYRDDGFGCGSTCTVAVMPATSRMPSGTWSISNVDSGLCLDRSTSSTPTLLRLVASHQIDAGRFATHHFDLHDFMAAYDTYERAADTGAVKVVLTR